MSNATSSRHGHRIRPVRPAVEVLEDRTLPSVTMLEAEPNDTRADANAIARRVDTPVTVGGEVGSPGDHDWFKVQLQAGDVLGAALKGKNGLDPKIRLACHSGTCVPVRPPSPAYQCPAARELPLETGGSVRTVPPAPSFESLKLLMV